MSAESLALHIRSANAEIVLLLLQAGVPPDTLIGGKTPLELALSNIDDQTVPDKVAPAAFDVVRAVVAAGPRGLSRAAHAALEDHAPGRLIALLRAGVPIDCRDDNGQSLAVRAMRLDEDAASYAAAGLTALLVQEGAPAPTPLATWVLLWAATTGRRSVIRRLLEQGLAVNATLHGDLPSEDIRESERAYWWPGGTTLHRVLARAEKFYPFLFEEADRYDGTLFRFLLDRGASPEAPDGTARTPLHIAAQASLLEPVQQLADRGANVEQRDAQGWTALRLSVRFSTATTMFLLERWIPQDHAERAELLHDAVQLRDPVLVKRLLELGCDPNLSIDAAPSTLFRIGQTWRSPMPQVRENSIPCLDLLLAHGADVLIKSPSGRTALHLFVASAEVEAIDRLLAAGADADARDQHDQTPLMNCATAAVAQRLLSAGSCPTRRDAYGYDALDHALIHGANDVYQLLTADGRPPRAEASLIAAIRDRDTAEVENLLASGVSARTIDPYGRSALHCAARHRSPSIIGLLLEKGADVSARDVDGNTPLRDCLTTFPGYIGSTLHDEEASINLLLDGGAATDLVDAFGNAALFVGQSFWGIPSVAARLLYCCQRARSKRGQTSLMVAVQHGTVDHVRGLVRRGMDVNAADAQGWTALHVAAYCFGEDAVEYAQKARLLLASGARLEAFDAAGETPLFAAVATSNSMMVETLLEAGADFTHRNRAGETVQVVALRKANAALVNRFRTLFAGCVESGH